MSDKTDPAPPTGTQPATQDSSQQKAAKQPSQSPAGNASPSAQNQQAQGSNAQGHPQGHRQHYQGNSPGGKPYYHKRNNSNYKGNGHSSGAHQNNNQYQNYAAYPQNMYSGYNYYAYPYAQGMVPGMNGIPAYNPQSTQPASQYPVSPGIGKVKITDKDGKQVDWEEKTKSSTSTPKTGAAQLSVPSTPNTLSSSAPASAESNTPAASAASAAAAAKSAAAEEFRKKILEKAQAAKKKKDEEKARLEAEAKAKEAAATPKEEPKPEKPVEVASEKPVEKVEEPVSEVPIEKPVEAAVEASVASAEPVIKIDETPVAPPAVESSTSSPASVSERITEVEAAITTTNAEPATETTPETNSETPEAENREVNTAEPTKLTEPKSESPAEETSEVAGPQEDTVSEPASDDHHDDDDDEEHEHGSEGPVFNLSSYFERVKAAKPIDDPFSFSYQYPSTGVDARWKSGAKKYRYDPQFLLQFNDCVQCPIDDAWKEKLESLGIVANRRSSGGPSRMNSNRMGSQSQGGRFNGSVPGRLGQFNDRQNSRSGSKRRGGSGGGNPRDKSLRNRGQSKRGREQEEPPKPVEDVKPLVPSANRWVPRSRAKTTEVKYAPDGSVLLESEDIERKVNSALNKLTLEMFEPITEDLLKIAKQSIWEEDAKTIKQVISLTFAKACDEPYWSSVYAQFCAKMLKEVPDEVKDVNTLTKNGEPATGGDLARRILLATCQVEYEKGWVDKLPTNEDGSPLEPEMMSEEYYIMAAAKRRGLGLVKFIGNLYILNMLNDQVILHCLRDQSKNLVDPSEDSLENLAQLIKTVGPRFEATERNRAALNLVYDNIQQILDNCKLSSRIKFMLMDLQDLRRSSWKSMKQDAGPKTIKEIHNEAELKKIEEGRANAEKRRQNKGGYNNNSGFGGDSRSNSARSGSSWGNKRDSRSNTKDSRGFTSVSRAQSNRSVAETTPSTSNLAPRETSKRTDSMASNMFAALGGDHEEEDAETHAN